MTGVMVAVMMMMMVVIGVLFSCKGSGEFLIKLIESALVGSPCHLMKGGRRLLESCVVRPHATSHHTATTMTTSTSTAASTPAS
jgi:hypothetical protein